MVLPTNFMGIQPDNYTNIKGYFMDVFIGKQPILNKYEQVIAYELLYRNKNLNEFPNIDQDTATIDVIINAFFTFGIDKLTENKPCFINFSETLIMHDFLIQLDPANIVIEILETVEITEELIKRIKELKLLGFKIALDDFVYNPTNTFYSKLLPYVDIIKIDFLHTEKQNRLQFEKVMQKSYPYITLLAEKVETRKEYEDAVVAGYTLFQGYFFEQPKIVTSKDIEANTVNYFQIMSFLRTDEPDIDEIAETIERDISLTYKLLKLVNTSNTKIRSNITSIRQAIMMLGLMELQKWIYLLAVRSDESIIPNNELLQISLFRSKVCEMLARQKGFRNYSEYYLVGMFSNIDSILQIPMTTILKDLPFSEGVLRTISGQETEMSPYLRLAISLQKLDWDTIVEYAENLEIPIGSLEVLYHSTNEWVDMIFYEEACMM